MTILGLPTVSALIERLTHDRELRLRCGWSAPSQVPKPATFSRARAEFVGNLPESINRLLPCNGREIDPLADGPATIPESNGADEPLLSMLNHQLRSMIRSENPDLTLLQLAVFMICSHNDHRQHTVASLAEELGLLPPDVAHALVKLERWRLIWREPDPRNRRRIIVVRTREGRRFLTEVLLRTAAGVHSTV